MDGLGKCHVGYPGIFLQPVEQIEIEIIETWFVIYVCAA